MEDLLANSVPWEGVKDSIGFLLDGLRDGEIMECTVCSCAGGPEMGIQFQVREGKLLRRESGADRDWWVVVTGPVWDDRSVWRSWGSHEWRRVEVGQAP